jgi:hypothetical protein
MNPEKDAYKQLIAALTKIETKRERERVVPPVEEQRRLDLSIAGCAT